MPWRAAYPRRSSRVRRRMEGDGAAGGSRPGGRPARRLAVRLVAWLTVVGSTPSRAPMRVHGQVQVVRGSRVRSGRGRRGRACSGRGRRPVAGAAGGGCGAVAALLAVGRPAGRPRRRPGRRRPARVQAGQRGVVQGGRVAQAGRGRRRAAAGPGAARAARRAAGCSSTRRGTHDVLRRVFDVFHLLVADLRSPWGRGSASSTAVTASPVVVLTAAMVVMMTS